MAKQGERWPISKVAASAAGCAAAAALLFWLSLLAEKLGAEPTTSAPAETRALDFPGLLAMLAMLAAILSFLGAIWLALRIRDARRPAWQKRGKKRRH